MLFWMRELAGWAMVAVGLLLAGQALLFAMNTTDPKIVEASVLMFGSIGILRAGVLLIRISTAARLCRESRERND